MGNWDTRNAINIPVEHGFKPFTVDRRSSGLVYGWLRLYGMFQVGWNTTNEERKSEYLKSAEEALASQPQGEKGSNTFVACNHPLFRSSDLSFL